MAGTRKLLTRIPGVDRLLEAAEAQEIVERYGRPLVVDALRETLEALRLRIRQADDPESLEPEIEPAALFATTSERLHAFLAPTLRRVINATGVVLHTGLGRAILSPTASEAIAREVGGYAYVEVDPATGERGERELSVRHLLCRLTGAEFASVVNNNAAATLITLAALARGKEVVVSRGQLVEIGGSFRIPDVMRESGARLVEVGTTNRTHLADYERAIGPETGAILSVHTSNYRVVGFTHSVPTTDLARLARKAGVPLIDDLGSGAFFDCSECGLDPEPTVREVLEAGVDIATFSGDKLLGGPQAGIVVGRTEYVTRVRRHPLYRAMRADKITYAVLEATLKGYLDPDRLTETNPTFRMLREPAASIRPRAESMANALQGLGGVACEVLEDASTPGSGSLPTTTIPTWIVSVRPDDRPAHRLAAALRLHRPGILGRLREDALLLDPRTIQPGEEPEIVAAVATILGRPSPA